MSRPVIASRATVLALAALVGSAALTGCSQAETTDYVSKVTVSTTAGPRPAASGAVAVLAPDLSGTGPGTLASATELDKIDPKITETGGRGMRVEYRSTSGIDGSETTVGGAVFVPAGTPPDGGWPVIAFGHANTGTRYGCGPSLHPDLLQNSTQVASLLANGYIVAMPDYEGLGTPGNFPMFEPKTLGANMIDAVRAAHRVSPEASRAWASFGTSIGGEAAWAANEMAADYAPEYTLVGTAALVPTVDMAGLAQEAAAGTLGQQQRYQYLLELVALKLTSQPTMRLEDYVSGETAANLELLTSCTGEDAAKAADLLNTLPASDVVPVDAEATDRVAGWIAEAALPKNRLTAPMLLVYSTADDIVRQEWIEGALRKSCDLGSDIETILPVGQGTADLDGSPALPWIKDAFDGASLRSNACAR